MTFRYLYRSTNKRERADKKAEAEYYRTLITNGIASVNEVREKLGWSPLEGDEYDKTYMQLSYGSLKNISDGVYVKQNAQDATGQVKNDNKVLDKE